MSLADQLALPDPARPVRRARPSRPKGWGDEGVTFDVTTGEPAGAVLGSDRSLDASEHRAAIEKQTGMPVPAHQDVALERLTIQRGADGEAERWWYKYKFVARGSLPGDAPDLAQLRKAARSSRMRAKTPPDVVESAMVVVWADPQTGKVARRGGTPELVARVEGYREDLADLARDWACDAAYLLDAGDGVESFESGGGPMAAATTNDLSMMDQVDVATTLEFELFKTLGQHHARAVLAGVGSNHCRWRAGKQNLGTPGDDWGLHMLKQIHRRMGDSPEKYGHMSVMWPDRFEETLALDVAGTIIGLAHGHQAPRPDGIPGWWAKQVHGGQPVADADILVTGHFHHLRVQPSGRNPVTDRSKWWLQAPTADNGSDFFRYTAGEDSDPGVLVFRVTADGWDRLTLL